ncbi:SGNH/GDSL hydrolase family protein [Staphylococcus pseudintermedius]|uniref:BppU family phage baseplate upper protein n=1 Tax=Staphylococcus pseudintermedius TaxID=283734 RepID=UPI000D72F01D|nr:BppU family phage baseplate upper protein [Staphylococcus pseudintermedius]MCE5687293.1 BppU family phage baseplate upper protein [Staphylococcus pseudintermedius]PWZ81775.1 SGNH/GDSL hydrolase family protein [Staphylococcus pseudintermedius]HDV6244641.1 BppU family phage baseplate upper protein [Staphylococcus pseudintermedius]
MNYKYKDIHANINELGVDIGYIGANFYSKDVGTASIRINVFWNGQPFDLSNGNYQPQLNLFCEDGSVFMDEPLEIISPYSGLIQYNVTDKVIRHSGKVKAKLFLLNEDTSIHALNFMFNIVDSGVDQTISKEVNGDLVYSAIKNTLKSKLFDMDELKKVVSDVVIDNKDDLKLDEPKNLSILKGKTGVFVGDSITEKNFRTTTNYHEFIAARTGLKVINMGISGTGFQDRKNVALEIKEQPDFICVFLGTNDYGLVGDKTNPLGTVEERSYKTVTGSIYFTLLQLSEHFHNTPIVVLTPLPRLQCYPFNEVENAAGYTLGQLVEAIKSISNMFGFPVLDLYHESNLRVWESPVNKTFFAYKEGQEDGLHPNEKGHEFISNTIQAFLENYAISPKFENNAKLPPDEVLSDGSIVKYLFPKGIFWKESQSFIINFDETEINLENKKVLKIESERGSIVNASGILENSPYWYTLPNNDGEYHRVDDVKQFTNNLTKSGYTTEKGYEYLPERLKITFIDPTNNIVAVETDTSTTTVNHNDSSDNRMTSVEAVVPTDNGDGTSTVTVVPKRIFRDPNGLLGMAVNNNAFDFEGKNIKKVEFDGAVLTHPESVENTIYWTGVNNESTDEVKSFINHLVSTSPSQGRSEEFRSEPINITYRN